MIYEKLFEPLGFNEVELSIIEYLKNNIDGIDKLTISKLSKETYTSISTINRFCHKIYNSGFKDFKIQLIKEINNRAYMDEHNIDPDIPFSFSDSLYDVANNLRSLFTNTINATHVSINFELLQETINILDKSKRIFVFAKGDTYITAMLFYNRLSKLNKYIILADMNSETEYNARNVGKDDCAVFISYSSSHSSYNRIIDLYSSKNINTILITANIRTYLAKKCSVLIPIPSDESIDSKIANFSSQLSINFILDIIYSGLFLLDYSNNIEDKCKKDKYTYNVM